MARRVYFAFHFENDIFRVNQVRNSNVVAGPDRAGFYDHSEYEEAKKKGDEEIKRLIRAKLENTTVTVVLIGSETASRPYVKYEIEQSVKRNNELLGIYIHDLVDQRGRKSARGLPPAVPPGVEFPVYDWDGNLPRFAREIEAAGQRSDALRRTAPHPPRRDTGFGSLILLALAILGAAALAAINVRDKIFRGMAVSLDWKTFTNCTFEDCTLATNTGNFRIRSCAFSHCAMRVDPNAYYGHNSTRISRLQSVLNAEWWEPGTADFVTIE
jgi:hypothetical protein